MFSAQEADIIVVDNASQDDSVSFLKNNFPGVRSILLDRNYGFAGGYNQALKHVENEYYMLLNSDIEVTPGWLGNLRAYLNANPQVASVQPKILSHARKTHFEHAGASGGFLDKFCYPFCRGRVFSLSEEDKGQYNNPVPVFWSSGACMLVRKKVFWEAGGFDVDFFAHMEEIDLCWRMQYLGYSVAVDPQSVVYHVGGGTLNYQNPRKTYLNFRNNLYLIHKNYFSSALIWYVIRRMKIDGIAAMVFLFTGKPSHFLAVFKAHVSYYRNIPVLNRKRKQVRAMVKQTELTGRLPKSVVWQYFIRGKKTFSRIVE